MSIYGNPLQMGGGGGGSIIVPKQITSNGTYDAAADNADGYNPIQVNVAGGGTIISKTITANGTYNASDDGADGYNPVIVNIGNRTLLANWDFTGANPLIDKVGGKVLTNYNDAVTFSSLGAYFTANVSVEQGLGYNQALKISIADLLGDGLLYGCDIEVDVGSFHKTEWGTADALRFIMANNTDGFGGRQATSNAHGWSIYRGSWSSVRNQMLNFENCTVKVSLSRTSTIGDIIYIDDLDFVGSSVNSMAQNGSGIILGAEPDTPTSSRTCIGGIYIKAMRVYRRKEFENT